MATRVLLVEKHSQAAKRMADELIDFGCHVRVAGDGEQALKELESAPYDLVLTEMGASPVRSLNLAKAIRQNHPGTRVVVTAGNARREPEDLQMLFDDPEPRRLLNLLSAGPGPRGAVLLVDDDPDDVAGLKELLISENYTVLTAQSGPAALDIARRRKVDAAVIDYKMPGMSGWDTYKALKEITPDVRAVVVTGCSLGDYVQRCFDADDVPVINKTFDPREMFGLVNAFLGARHQLREGTLLLVDDEGIIREDLAEFLRSKGLLVQTAARGDAALALAREVSFDLAIVDYFLPDMSGLELVEKLRELRSEAEVVILTGHPDMDSAMRAVHLRVHEYLSKPVLPEKLLETLRKALRHRRLEQQVRDLAHELHDANRRLQDLDRMKSKFLFIMAHDIRSPLAAVRGFAQYLLQQCGDALPIVREGLQSILRGSKNISRLVEDVLDLGRMESGKLAIRPQSVDLTPFLKRQREAFQIVAGEAGVELVCDFSRAPRDVQADPLRLEQIIGNLVNNALKHARTGRWVGLTVAAEGDFLSISVQDRGPGMTAETIAHIFDPYYQGQDDSKGGIGLGLSIVKELVEGHGGRVHAESAGAGTGSTFRAEIPLRQPDGVSPAPEDED
jgi:signal transduction histidine kinase